MSFVPDLQLLSYALSRARMSGRPGPRPAREIAMAARRQYARQLGRR